MIVRRCRRCYQPALRIPVQVERGEVFHVYCGHCGERQVVLGTLSRTDCRFGEAG